MPKSVPDMTYNVFGAGASIPMGQGGHVPPIFMKGRHPW